MIVLLSVRRERNRLSAISGRAKADGGANLHTRSSQRQLFRHRLHRLAHVSAYSAFGIGSLLRSAARRRYSFAIARSSVAAVSFDAAFAWFRQMRASSTRSSYEVTRTPSGHISHLSARDVPSSSSGSLAIRLRSSQPEQPIQFGHGEA